MELIDDIPNRNTMMYDVLLGNSGICSNFSFFQALSFTLWHPLYLTKDAVEVLQVDINEDDHSGRWVILATDYRKEYPELADFEKFMGH